MIPQADNEDLVRTGPGTVMGNFFRLFWIPFLPSADLVADGRPQRVRLLGEDLVAFRDSEGKVGLLDAACPHRRAPLAYGRNEQCGLRCVYHGWKINVRGEVVDMPAERKTTTMKMVKMKAYPCQERNGMVWTYMGPNPEDPPPLPNMEWNLVPEEQRFIGLRVQPGNYLQVLEGDIDSAHAPILHSRIDSQGTMSRLPSGQDPTPSFEVEKQDFGLSVAAIRRIGNGQLYARVNQLVFPFFTFVGPQPPYPELTGHAWVPMDDMHTLCIMFSYHPNEPLNPRTRQLYEEGYKGRETGHASRHAYVERPGAPYAKYWTKFTPENDFLFDYESQTTTWYSGLPGLWVQDVACQVGASLIADRTKEHLVTSDTGIVHARRVLLQHAREYAKTGAVPAGIRNPDVGMIRPICVKLGEEDDWRATRETYMHARLGTGFGYEP